MCHVSSATVLNNHTIHGQKDSLVDWLPLTGYEPNATVEVSSAEVAPILPPSRRASFCSVYNSGEDVITTLVSSKSMRDKTWEMLASPLLTQKREASALPAIIYHSIEKVLRLAHRIFKAQGDLIPVYSQERKSSRDPRNTLETHSARERIRTEHEEVRDHLKLLADKAAKGKRQPYQDSLKRNIIQDDFLKSKGIRCCPKQDLG